MISSTYLRLLELEGRHPEDAGNWSVSLQRLQKGEGILDEDEPELGVLVLSILTFGLMARAASLLLTWFTK